MINACVQRFDVMDGRGNILGSERGLTFKISDFWTHTLILRRGLNFPHLAASLMQQPDQQEPARGSALGRGIAPATAGVVRQQQNDGMSSAVAQQEGGGGVGNPYFQDEEALFETPQYVRNMAAGMMMSPPQSGRRTTRRTTRRRQMHGDSP
jgi:hypothetical protein